MGKGVVCHFFSNCLFATSRCIEKEAVDKMIAHFVTAPFSKNYIRCGKESFPRLFFDIKYRCQIRKVIAYILFIPAKAPSIPIKFS